ncbi:hypothetical protein [Tenacibaculum agarivorans]|uniref:hypothetical protein n=1 Tax=Tenacibaculum agarivorans TaxID=1908389 RepID=UPI000A6CFE77|nr:hypothetical protein [Tenacibaculum agarivorans]
MVQEETEVSIWFVIIFLIVVAFIISLFRGNGDNDGRSSDPGDDITFFDDF